MSQGELFRPGAGRAAAARDEAVARVSANAEERAPDFGVRARACILDTLASLGPCDGEALTDACLAVGIVPHDLRAFGGVFQGMAKAGLIERTGEVRRRRRGHLTSGANVWRLTAPGGSA